MKWTNYSNIKTAVTQDQIDNTKCPIIIKTIGLIVLKNFQKRNLQVQVALLMNSVYILIVVVLLQI